MHSLSITFVSTVASAAVAFVAWMVPLLLAKKLLEMPFTGDQNTLCASLIFLCVYPIISNKVEAKCASLQNPPEDK